MHGMRIYKRDGAYYVSFTHNGERFRRSLKTDKLTEARRRADDFHRRVVAGERLANEQKKAAPFCLNLLAEYRDDLARRGCTAMHITHKVTVLARLVADSGAERMDELDTPAMTKALAYLADRSPRTQNFAVVSLQSWFNWLRKTKRWKSDAADAIERVREAKAKPERRALTVAELERITTFSEIPESRQLIYAVAAATGLRKGELAALRVVDVDLAQTPIILQLGEEATKNRKRLIQPCALPEALRSRWAKILEAASPTDSALGPMPNLKTFKRDLSRAGIPLVTPAGRLDFHALRVTYGSHLAAAGIPLALTQKLMRHSTPALTANIYTRWAPESHEDAALRLLDFQGARHKIGTKQGDGESRPSNQAG